MRGAPIGDSCEKYLEGKGNLNKLILLFLCSCNYPFIIENSNFNNEVNWQEIIEHLPTIEVQEVQNVSQDDAYGIGSCYDSQSN